jgi:L-lactate dehydrogenase complex protein LldF
VTRTFEGSPPFGEGARRALGDDQLRHNLANATTTIRNKRDRVVGELDTWEDLRLAGEAIKTDALGRLDTLLETLEARVAEAGGVVHWARDAAEANRIIVGIVTAHGVTDVVKVKSMTTTETGLNPALEAAGITPYETDLAELIVQLGDDLPSHIVVPAIHRSREEIRRTFAAEMGKWGRPAPEHLTDDPADLAATARLFLRERFLSAEIGISGANFLVAETGSVAVVESEGNGRMCVTLPRVLISVAGIDKVIPSWEDLDVFFQVLPRSATGERMNPYNSVWTGTTAGDGPEEFHLVLVDNGRSRALGDRVGRQALRCIRCAACLNVCPVYERVGGHAYGSVYPGPIGAVLTPQLDHVAGDEVAASLPYASTLCGACFDACPVRIDIPRLLVHLRGEVVDANRSALPASQEQAAMATAGWLLARPRRLAAAVRAGRLVHRVLGDRRLRLPGFAAGWTAWRATPLPSEPSFAEWWHKTRPSGTALPARFTPAPLARRAGRRRGVGPVPAGLRAATAEKPHPGTGPAEPPGAARHEILGRVRASLGKQQPPVGVPRAYRRAPGPRPADPVELFAQRVDDYRATVTRVAAGGLAAAIATLVDRQGSTAVVVPADQPATWTAALTAAVHRDHADLATAALDGIDTVITGCAVGIAETGTVVLDGGPGQGRRAITLVPDHHVVVVAAEQIVAGVPDAMARIRRRAPQTWISGPSATSDIELNRVEGVHGPRRLDVIIVDTGP